MADPNWTDYIGVIAGVIGAITGITGGILGVISYRRSNQIKSLDLRLELKKSLNIANAAYIEGIEIIEESLKSRIAVSSAQGKLRSGGMDKWKERVESDKVYLNNLKESLPSTESEFKEFNANQLEQLIVKAHELQTSLSKLVTKYREEIARDDKDREFIREQAHARIN